MEAALKSIGWNNIRPDTLTRMNYFSDAFKEYYAADNIPDSYIDFQVAMSFGRYGEEQVYNIYSVSKSLLGENETISDCYARFDAAFQKEIPETYDKFKVSFIIDLFIEYIYSKFIKGDY